MSGVNSHLLLATKQEDLPALQREPSVVWQRSRCWAGPFLHCLAHPVATGSKGVARFESYMLPGVLRQMKMCEVADKPHLGDVCFSPSCNFQAVTVALKAWEYLSSRNQSDNHVAMLLDSFLECTEHCIKNQSASHTI